MVPCRDYTVDAESAFLACLTHNKHSLYVCVKFCVMWPEKGGTQMEESQGLFNTKEKVLSF